MVKNNLIDNILTKIFREKSKIESRTSYFKMRSYLDQLDVEQLQSILEESGN